MKSLSLFLGLYILALACMPCSDYAVCSDQSSALDLMDNDHQEHEHTTDLCSPFCTCICCGLTVTHSYYQTQFSDIPRSHYASFSDYCPNHIPEVYLHIWQPPKII